MQNNHSIVIKTKNRRQLNKNSPKTPKTFKNSIITTSKPQQPQQYNYTQKMETKENENLLLCGPSGSGIN